MPSQYVLPNPEFISMSAADAQRLISAGSGDAALLYIYILKNGGEFSYSSACESLKKSRLQIENAISVLSSLGLVTIPDVIARPKEEKPISSPREYTALDIQTEIANGSDFKFLVSEAERSLGKILSSSELITLFGIYNDLHLPPEVILQLITHCMDEYKNKYGTGRIPTMRYIEKAAYTWERNEIFSIDRAEEYLKNLSHRRSIYGEMKASLQIKGRDFTPSEQKYVDSWIEMGFGSDAVEIAFDRTVLKTGKLAWSYLNSIMKSWHTKNLHTAEEIAELDTKPQPKVQANASSASIAAGKAAPKLSDMERMKKMLKNINKN